MHRFMLGVAAIAVLSACTTSDSVTLHLRIAVDHSTAVAGDTSRAADRIMSVVRMRAEEFGVRHPVLEQIAPDRIAATLPRVSDPARLVGIIAIRGVLEFRIVDMASAFATALPSIDEALVRAGVAGRPPTRVPIPSSAIQSLMTLPDAEAQRPHSPRIARAAPLGALLSPGGIPGAFVVPQEDVQRVDTLVRHDGTRAAMPRGVELVWAWPTPASVWRPPTRSSATATPST